MQIDKGPAQLLSEKPISLPVGKHRISTSSGSQEVQVSDGVTLTVKVSGSLAEQLTHDAAESLRNKDLTKAQSLIERARRVGIRTGARPQLLSELIYLQAKIYDARGQWREAMNEYEKYQSLPPAHQRAETLSAVRAAVAKLAPRMGLIQIFTLVNGKCKLTEKHYLPLVSTSSASAAASPK